jgi:TonB-linked SusC/RagA family outer membrane protein
VAFAENKNNNIMKLNYVKTIILILLLGLCSQIKAQESSFKDGLPININKQKSVNLGGKSLFKNQNDKKFPTIADTSKKYIPLSKDNSALKLNMGYGRYMSKESLTSSVSIINVKKLNGESFLYPGNALFGQAPGLWVMQNSGLPDSRNPSMFVRGISTLGSKNLLVLVDGFERPLYTVSLYDIKTIKILKDAAAKAIYGQRGANGVILITTKNGGNHKIQFNASYERGLTQPKRVPEFVNAGTYSRVVNQARLNDGLIPQYSAKAIQYYMNGNHPKLFPDVNWVNQTIGNFGAENNFDFNASGGTKKVKFYTGLSYHGEVGFLNHTKLTSGLSSQIKNHQINILSKGSLQATPTTNVKVNLNFMIRNYQRPVGAGIIHQVYTTPSNAYPIKNIDGSWGGSLLHGPNPVAELKSKGRDLTNHRYISFQGQIKQKLDILLKGLSATFKVGHFSSIGANENKTKNFSYASFDPVLGSQGNIIDTVITRFGKNTHLEPSSGVGNQHVNSSTFLGLLNYVNTFGSSNIEALISFRQHSKNTNVFNDVFRWQNLAGNIHYGYRNTYLFDFTLSYAGSNRIKNLKDRWGLFPAISGAWLISNEPFWGDNNSINKLKLRASWGITGNGFITIQDLTSPKFGGGWDYNFGRGNNTLGGIQQTSFGIPKKKFEKSYETDIGLVIELFDKLHLSGDIFSSRRKNILVNGGGAVSKVLGISPGKLANGIVDNKGFEFKLGWNDHIGNFIYSLTGIMSVAKNKIINNDEQFFPYSYLKREGNTIEQIYGWKSKGFFKNVSDIDSSPAQMFGPVKPGDVKYVDENGDDVINNFDRVPLGDSPFPQKYYSINLSLGYKGFGLSTSLQGVTNRSILLTSDIYWPLGANNNNISTWYTNYWSPNNTNNPELPRLTTQANRNNFRNSNVWLRNGNFLKIRYADISYSFPHSLISKAGFKKAVLYLRGRNLYTFSKFRYADPENVSSTYPSIRSFILGFNIKF